MDAQSLSPSNLSQSKLPPDRLLRQGESPVSLPTAESGSLVPTGHPRAFWFIFWGEFAERCSFYGMRAILLLYLTQVLGFSDRAGSSIYFAFKMAVYFLPLLGGFLADRYIGKYWSIVGFSVPY